MSGQGSHGEHSGRPRATTSTASTVAPAGAMLLIASRALMDAADMIEHSVANAPIDDYAGRDVLCGLGRMRPADADVLTRAIVQATLDEVCARLRADADRDFDLALSQIGSTVRAERRSPRAVQHRRPAQRSGRRAPAKPAAARCATAQRSAA